MSPARTRFGKTEYRQLLLNSMFAPCPMGNANIECYRTFEALESGAVPIVEKRLTLDYYRELLGPDFPGLIVSSWREARQKIAHLLSRPEELNALQQKCIEWWTSYKVSYTGQVGAFLERRSAQNVRIVNPIRAGRARLPFWQELELIRHHSARALGRRVRRQFVRLARQRRWRVAYRPSSGPSASKL
jgi:hypothetical protein